MFLYSASKSLLAETWLQDISRQEQIARLLAVIYSQKHKKIPYLSFIKLSLQYEKK